LQKHHSCTISNSLDFGEWILIEKEKLRGSEVDGCKTWLITNVGRWSFCIHMWFTKQNTSMTDGLKVVQHMFAITEPDSALTAQRSDGG